MRSAASEASTAHQSKLRTRCAEPRSRRAWPLDLASRRGASWRGIQPGRSRMSAVETLSKTAPKTAIPTADELVARARALAPRLRERAVAAERDRNIPRESVQ